MSRAVPDKPVLALYTYGAFLRPSADPANDGFHALNDPVMARADAAPGMIARSGYASDPGPAPWGQEVYPSFHIDNGDGWSPATLSLWRDPESLYAFTYSGLHARALARGRDWFQAPRWPPLVLWWHCVPTPPQWAEGVARIECLQANGPAADAFDFSTLFDPQGQPCSLDQSYIAALTGQ